MVLKKIATIVLIVLVFIGTGVGCFYCYMNLSINSVEEGKCLIKRRPI